MGITVPDRAGRTANVVLGFETVDEYQKNPRYLGAIIGRYANRIAHGRFSIDGTSHTVTANEKPHHLHGGWKGFDQKLWRAERLGANALVLRHTSVDGDEGFPGNLETQVSYTVTEQDELVVDYLATADRPTPVNLTQHSYFNLAGGGDILGHHVQINADAITAVGTDLIPTGELTSVADTLFDFRTPVAVGARRAGSYDHNYVLKGEFAARVHEPVSGRTLQVRTTEPGLQLYTSGFVNDGLCLETQHFPDSPNQPGFPSTILRPGSAYRSRTVFAFSTGHGE